MEEHKLVESLEVLFRDDYLVAINKPHGYVVHRSGYTRNANKIVLQSLRDQLQQRVYPIHRLDRKTSGVLILALNPEVLSVMSNQFQTQKVKKVYQAIVRGWTDDAGIIDYALTNDNGKLQSAVTTYTTIARFEMALPQGLHSTSRYSEVQLVPQTGRMHQLRKHMAHIFHPILGDRPHGCNKQNRLWKQKFAMDTMLLHASQLTFQHPDGGRVMHIKAPFSSEYRRVLNLMRAGVK